MLRLRKVPAQVQRLLGLIRQELDMEAADAAKKMFDKEMFFYYWYLATGRDLTSL